MQPQPFTKLAEVIHMDALRRNREIREEAAKNAQINVDNRNLSDAWSKR